DAQRGAQEAAQVGLDEGDRADGDQGEQLLPGLEAGDEGVELDEEVLEHEMSFRSVMAPLFRAPLSRGSACSHRPACSSHGPPVTNVSTGARERADELRRDPVHTRT